MTMNSTVIPEVGIHEGVPDTVYHSWDAVSKSGLFEFSKNPGKYRLGKRKATTKNMLLGTAIDVLLFDGEDEFERRFAVKPEGYKGSTKADKEWRAANAHLQQLSIDEADACRSAAEAIMRYEPAIPYFTGGRSQLSLVWVDSETGLLCKARPDYKPDCPFMADLKSTNDVSAEAFGKIAWDFRYHWQAAFYSDGWEILTGEHIDKFVFGAVEMERPNAVEVYDTPIDIMDLGRDQYRSVLDSYAACKETDTWLLSSGEEQTLTFPSWAWR